MTDETRAVELVDALASELRLLTKQIHDAPEMGGLEFKACAWQEELLGKYGFAVESNFCGLATAYRASYQGRRQGAKIAFLAEYDALPGLGHGCGHNLIAMAAVGCGIVCREFADKYGGRIDVIGTPAEETSNGKVPMAAKGVFKQYDAVMMVHPAFTNAEAVCTMALDGYQIEFFGKAAHAAIAPHEGCNALDAMINFYNMVNAMRQEVKSDARIHGIITDGGKAANIIPDYTAAKVYIRANHAAYVKEIAAKMRNCAEGAALGTGCTCRMIPCEVSVKDTRVNRELNELAVSCVEKFTVEPLRRMEKGFAFGSSDFGDVSYEAPAIQLLCRAGDYPDPLGGLHTPEMVEASASEYAMENTLNFVKGLSLTAAELMAHPEHLLRIRTEVKK